MLIFVVRQGTFSGGGFSIGFAGLVLGVMTNASMGAVLMLRRPGNIIGLVLMLTAVLTTVTLLGWVAGAALSEQRGPHDTLAGLVSLVGALGFLPSLILAGPLLALLFPTGRLPGPRWRWPVAGIIAAVVIGSTIVVARPGPIAGTAVDNPFGASGFSGSEAFWTIGHALGIAALAVALLLAVAAVIVRFRRSQGVERAQLKWFVAANVAVGAFLTLGFADGGILGLVAAPPDDLRPPRLASSVAPADRGRDRDPPLSPLRDRPADRTHPFVGHRHRAARRRLRGAVVGLQAVLADFIEGQTVAVAASTLVAFALFQPLRRRVQSAVDRRFDRPTTTRSGRSRSSPTGCARRSTWPACAATSTRRSGTPSRRGRSASGCGRVGDDGLAAPHRPGGCRSR